ncbi:unnamed protein product [Schistosoma bovis]|nr:unnamed protein product [Schistosoma bovis]
MLLYLSHEEEHAEHTGSYSDAVRRSKKRFFVCWNSHGRRIIRESFKTKRGRITLNVIECYAPTNDNSVSHSVTTCDQAHTCIGPSSNTSLAQQDEHRFHRRS